jgi:hypothetical protein
MAPIMDMAVLAREIDHSLKPTLVDERAVASARRRRSRAGRPERDIYASFTRLEARAPGVMFLFSLVAHGQCDRPTALAVAREIFFEAPRRLMGVRPR